jgi:molybdopterin-containing oxidoreductase family iron-sulfur binding subunit
MTQAPKASLRAFFESGWRALSGQGQSPEAAKAEETGKQGGCGGNCTCSGSKQPAAAMSATAAMTATAAKAAAAEASPAKAMAEDAGEFRSLLSAPISRRSALGHMLKGAMAGAAAMAVPAASAASGHAAVPEEKAGEDSNAARLKFEEFLKKNYRVMTKSERRATVKRLEKLARLERGKQTRVSTKDALEGVLFGYAFNISKCRGYMDCVKACVEENNQDRASGIQYITIHEMKPGQMGLHSSNKQYYHEVPADGHFYLGTQCFHCDNPPCTKVCPVGATWKEKDGIVVIDYDWCIGCRYCEAACPYFGRRFNWGEPEVPTEELNPNQHYLGNRPRKKGVMEKCTFCVQRTREGRQPACVEACPTGARVFGNLLDPKSEIRWILANKKVFRFKEELGTEPKFWYYMD